MRLCPKGGPWRSLGAPCVPLESVKQRPRQAHTGRVRATLRRASKRWTSFSRSAQVARGRGVLGPRKPACPVGDVPGFASTGPARDRESAAHSGDGGETHIGSICRRRLRRAQIPCKGRTRPAGPAVIGARLPLDRWRSRGLLTKPLNETDPAPGASRKRRSAGAGLRGDGPGGGLAPASSHLDGEAGARRRRPAPSETEVARVHRRSQRATPVKRRLHAGKRPAATS